MVFWVLLSSRPCFHVNFYCSDRQKFLEKEFGNKQRWEGIIFTPKFRAILNLILLPFFMRTHDLFVVEIRRKFEGSTHISRLSCRHRWESNLGFMRSIMPSPQRACRWRWRTINFFRFENFSIFQYFQLRKFREMNSFVSFITRLGFINRNFALFCFCVTRKLCEYFCDVIRTQTFWIQHSIARLTRLGWPKSNMAEESLDFSKHNIMPMVRTLTRNFFIL